jgi:hypothetical protein
LLKQAHTSSDQLFYSSAEPNLTLVFHLIPPTFCEDDPWGQLAWIIVAIITHGTRIVNENDFPLFACYRLALEVTKKG